MFLWTVGTPPIYMALHPRSHEKLKSHVWPSKACGLLDRPTGLTFQNRTYCLHSIVFISEHTATLALYNTNWLVFTTDIKRIYCAVRICSLNRTVQASSWNIHQMFGRAAPHKPNVLVKKRDINLSNVIVYLFWAFFLSSISLWWTFRVKIYCCKNY
jgi:hypothetical protein